MVLGISKRTLVVVAIIAGVALIYIVGSQQRSSAGAEGESGCRVAVTADVLNLRSAPAPDSEVVGKLTHNARSPAEPAVRNGFRKLAEHKWAAAEFLNPVDGAACG